MDLDLDRLTTQVTDRLDSLESTVRDHLPLDRFTAPDPIVRTTWPRRLLWTAVGFAAGTAVAYLADPDRGRARRTELQQRLQSTMTDVADDPKTLEARIKSQVFGHRDDVSKVVLRVDGPGTVAVKGTVPTPVAERELLAEIAEVDGVTTVDSELTVAAG